LGGGRIGGGVRLRGAARRHARAMAHPVKVRGGGVERVGVVKIQSKLGGTGWSDGGGRRTAQGGTGRAHGRGKTMVAPYLPRL
jgi:hypothetical protein